MRTHFHLYQIQNMKDSISILHYPDRLSQAGSLRKNKYKCNIDTNEILKDIDVDNTVTTTCFYKAEDIEVNEVSKHDLSGLRERQYRHY